MSSKTSIRDHKGIVVAKKMSRKVSRRVVRPACMRASRVDVRLEYDELGMTKIVVRDDGQGIPYEDAPQLFTRLGGSWKHPGGRTKTKERMLHGYEGRGRFKVFGASAIKCCYAAAGSGTGAEETELRALVSSKTSIRDHKGIVVAKKMSRKVSRRVVRPACIAGVRISRPNFRAPCGRTKL